MRTSVIIRTQFSATHNWQNMPKEMAKEVGYLSYPHRHLFHVEMKWETIQDREIEFMVMKKKVDHWLHKNWTDKFLQGASCETLALKLLKEFKADCVSVFEDNENGAEVCSQ